MRARGRGRRRAALSVAIVVALGLATEALANGGTLRLTGVPVGPYLMSVFTDPTPVTPDSIDVSVLVQVPETGDVVNGLSIVVTSRILDGSGRSLEHEATRAQSDDPERYYSAKFALGSIGRWNITVRAEGRGVSGHGTFELRVRERGLLDNPWALTGILLLPLVLVGVWMLRGASADPRSPGNGENAVSRRRSSRP